MMKHRVTRAIALAALAALAAGITLGAGWLYGTHHGHQIVRVSVDGTVLQADPPPILVGGTAYVPIRALSGLMGWQLEWDDGTRTVLVDTGQEGEPMPQQTFDTGWQTKSAAGTGSVVLPAGRILTQTVQFRGRSTSASYSTATATTSGSGTGGAGTSPIYCALPAVPGGYVFNRHEALIQISAGLSGDWSLQVKLPDADMVVAGGTGTSGSTPTTTQAINKVGSNAVASAIHSANYTYTLTARTRGYLAPAHSIDPSVTIDGVAVGHTGTLTNGQESAVYNLSSLAVETSNTYTVAVTGSGQVDVRIIVTMETGQTVSYSEPDAYERVARAALTIQLSATGDVAPATDWYPRIKADRNGDMSSPEYDWDSSASQVDWDYWDGLAWQAMPGAGAPIGAPVRFTPPADDMGLAWWHLEARSYDATTAAWGAGATRSFRLAQTIATSYALEIEAVDYTANVREILISQTTTGDPGGIQLVLALLSGETVPGDGNAVDVALKDILNVEVSYIGKVRGDPARVADGYWRVYCKLPDAQLSEQRILRTTDYPDQDIGATFKAIIDTYYSGFDSTGIDIATGYSRPITVWGRTAADIANELRRQYSVLIYVDATTLPATVVLKKLADLGTPTMVLARGQIPS